LRWDENIALPIPFFTSLLRRYAEKEGLEAAAGLAVFLLENRPVQRKTAQRGLLTLAADAMKRFSSPRQIANLRRELSFMPEAEQMPEDYGKALRPLLELSEDTQKALREYNPANQLRLLKSISLRLAEFQKVANLSRQRSWAAFGQVSLQWKRVIEKEVSRIGQSTGLPLPNPFITGNPIREKDSPLFVGRRDIINQIQTEALREGAAGAILFAGNRRTGKTTALLHLERFLPSTLRPAFFDCQSPFLQSSLASFSAAVGQGVMERCGMEKEPPPTDLAALTTLLEKAQKKLEAQNHYLLICMDEYERLGPLIANGTLPGLADTFRYWIQHYPRLILLFAGSHELAEAQAVDWTDYLINVRTVRISYLEEEAALQLATHPIPDFGLRYASEELPLAFVRRLGRRQPYLLQCALYELVEHLNNDGNRRTATAADLEVAIQQMFIAATNHFEHFWKSELEERGREVVRRLSQGLPIPEEEPAVKRLVRKEVLRREEGRLVFCVPAVGEWVRENY
ncbi:MAG: ATP-binding protein, partial [Phaeodactylibacter sp.]|nr:ATP-binding protein [Phaeodactylibacter sp.]